MGNEIECGAIVDGAADRGKALLESDYLLFRGTSRVKLMFVGLRSVDAVDGVLTLTDDNHAVVLELGSQAQRWADKIRNPKSLLDKLGVIGGEPVTLIDVSDESFLALLSERGAAVVADVADARLTFLQVETLGELTQVASLAAAITAGAALWIIAPKGRAHIKDVSVIVAGRGAGLVDVKVCSFSATHTALKFVRRSV